MSQDTVISLTGLDADKQHAIPASIPSDYGVIIAPKPIWQRAIYPPKIGLNGLLIGCFFALIAVLSGFMPIPLPSPFNGWLLHSSQTIQYTVQLPWLLVTAAALGPFMGTAAVSLFIMAGLMLFPVFANGGGWHYVFEPGFGYLLATLMIGSWLAKTFHKALQKSNVGSRSLKLLQKAAIAVFMVHLLGGLCLVGLTFAGFVAWENLGAWLYHLSLEKMPYDFLATTVLLALVRQIRLGLWLVLY